MTLVPYTLPDGRVVGIYESTAKGAGVVTYTLESGRVVVAVRGSKS